MRIIVKSPNGAIDIDLTVISQQGEQIGSVSIDLKDATVNVETDKVVRVPHSF